MATGLPSAETPVDRLADAVCLIDPDASDIVGADRCARESLGLNREDVLDRGAPSLRKDGHGLPQRSGIADASRGTGCSRFGGRRRHRAGHELEVEINTTRFELDGLASFLSLARDITHRVAREGSGQRREKPIVFELNEVIDGLWDGEVATGQLFFGPQFKRMRGHGPGGMASRLDTWAGGVNADDSGSVMAVLREPWRAGERATRPSAACETATGTASGCTIAARVCEYAPAGRPRRLAGTVQDITERRALDRRLRNLAAFDILTGLSSRLDGPLAALTRRPVPAAGAADGAGLPGHRPLPGRERPPRPPGGRRCAAAGWSRHAGFRALFRPRPLLGLRGVSRHRSQHDAGSDGGSGRDAAAGGRRPGGGAGSSR